MDAAGCTGSGLVLGERTRAATQQFSGLHLRESEMFPNGADLLGGD